MNYFEQLRALSDGIVIGVENFEIGAQLARRLLSGPRPRGGCDAVDEVFGAAEVIGQIDQLFDRGMPAR